MVGGGGWITTASSDNRQRWIGPFPRTPSAHPSLCQLFWASVRWAEGRTVQSARASITPSHNVRCYFYSSQCARTPPLVQFPGHRRFVCPGTTAAALPLRSLAPAVTLVLRVVVHCTGLGTALIRQRTASSRRRGRSPHALRVPPHPPVAVADCSPAGGPCSPALFT